jgi:hypothetical protein
MTTILISDVRMKRNVSLKMILIIQNSLKKNPERKMLILINV